jgi:hypothetical protein
MFNELLATALVPEMVRGQPAEVLAVALDNPITVAPR